MAGKEVVVRIGILMFDEMELLDMAGPYEVFTTASRVQARSQPAESTPFSVSTVAVCEGPVRARAGVRVLPDATIEQRAVFDVLVLPGGVVDAELERPALLAWIAWQASVTGVLASVCTGAFLLAKAGLLDGRDVTTHWEDVEALRQGFPRLRVHTNRRWLDAGSVVTSAGISAGIDMSLYLVERLHSRELALRTARQMDYAWTEA
jgi:transcriptional regulator GlxA family with amidase domain